MAAGDTYSANLNLTLPARGGYLNTWDTPLNANFATLDQRIAGSTAIDVSAGSVALTQAQMQFASLVITGAIGNDVSVTLPANIGGLYSVWNTTGGAGQVHFVIGNTNIVVPKNVRTMVFTDGGSVLLADAGGQSPPGTMMVYAGASVPSGYLLCYGQAVSRTTYASLFSAINAIWGGGDGSTTFNLPDMRGRVAAGADNMGGTAANRLDQIGGLGGVGGNEGFSLAVTNLPSHSHTISDPGHNHAVNDTGHFHTYFQSANQNTTVSGSAAPGNNGGSTSNTGSATTGVTIKNNTTGITATDNAGGNAAFSIVQPTAAINWIIKT